jgi:hypothetical protein
MRTSYRTATALQPFIALVLFWATIVSYAQQPTRKAEAWDTCIFIEGKGDFCHAADKATNFRDYLGIEWTFDPLDGLTLESGFNLLKPAEHKITAMSEDIGRLGNSRMRSVKYLIDAAPSGSSVILAERADGLWVPLMKIAGDLPRPALVRDGVIAMSKNFGGNVPDIRTWAWVWNGAGPLLLDPYTAVAEATEKLGTGYGCYRTEIEWATLHNLTWWLHGEYRSRGSFHYQLDVWFDLKGAQLVPKRLELVDVAQEGPREEPKHWP